MGAYQQVRSSSPHQRTPYKDEEFELGQQLQGQENADEQKERLLSSDDDDDETPATTTTTAATTKRRRNWRRIGLFGLAGLAAAVLLASVWRDWYQQHGDKAALQSFWRPSSDYIIDGNWDYNATATTREYEWVVTDLTANPDGVFRPMMVINGQFPGPMIVCNEGDTIVVNVVNHAKNATSIHWHGLFQNGSNWNDGAAGITQCPIAPGQSFRYEFTVKGQAGSCECAFCLFFPRLC